MSDHQAIHLSQASFAGMTILKGRYRLWQTQQATAANARASRPLIAQSILSGSRYDYLGETPEAGLRPLNRELAASAHNDSALPSSSYISVDRRLNIKLIQVRNTAFLLPSLSCQALAPQVSSSSTLHIPQPRGEKSSQMEKICREDPHVITKTHQALVLKHSGFNTAIPTSYPIRR